MFSAIYFTAVAALAGLSFTRRRVWIICGFYSFYALLTVLDVGNVPRLGPVTVYRALYLILLISLTAHFVQNRNFLRQSRRWLVFPYVLLLVGVLASSLYSIWLEVFSAETGGIFGYLVMISLFWMSAAHVRQESDLKVFALTAVAVSFILSLWVF